MRRELIVRLLVVWFIFGLGISLGYWIGGRRATECKTQLVDFDNDGLTSAALAALPAATTGSGTVTFTLDLTGIRVHAESALPNQTYDARVAAVIRGSPVTLELPSTLLRRLLTR